MKLPFKRSFWINSLFITLFQRFSLFFFALVGFFILTHYSLSNQQVGTYALFQTIITMMEYMKMGLLRNALIKFIYDNRFKEKLQEVQSASLVINIIFSALVIVFFLLCSGSLARLLKTPELETLLYWSIVLIIFQVPFNHCEIVQQSRMRYRPIFFAYFLRQGLLFLFIVSSLFFQEKILTIQHLVIAQIAAMILSSGYFMIVSRKFLTNRLYIDKSIIAKLLQFGKYVFGTAMLSHVYKFADHFVTAYAIGPGLGQVYVSYYSVVGRIAGVMDVPFLAVADVLFPKNAQAMATEGSGLVTYYFEKMVGRLTALIIPASLFILFVPGLVIKIVAGPDYMEAVPILQVTMLFSFLRPFFTQFGYTMDSIGKPEINFRVNLIFLVISLTSTYLSIQWFGNLMGAVYASSFTMVLGCIVFYVILKNSLNIRLSNIAQFTLITYRDLFTLVKKITIRTA
ncbi:MAG: oligosaccharide flippase family protein [Chitinophagaceae bacterium]